MKKIKKSELIIIIVLCAVMIIAPFISLLKKEELNDENSINISVLPVKNENRYMIVESSVETFVSYVKYRNIDGLMSILDKKFVEKEDINSNNVLDLLETYDELYVVDVREIYQIKKYDNIYIYYVKAKLAEEEYSSYNQTFIKTVYYQVTINENTLTFAISPLDSDEYIEKVG